MEQRKEFTFEQEKEARNLYEKKQTELPKLGYECLGYEYGGEFDPDWQVCVWKKNGKEFKHKFLKDDLSKKIIVVFN